MRLLFLLLLVTGCTASLPSKPLPLIPETNSINIPSSLLVDCSSFQPLTLQTYTQADILSTISIWSQVHQDCSERFHELRNLLEQAFHIPDISNDSIK